MMEQRSDFVKSHEENRNGKSRITAKRDSVIAEQSCGADESIYGGAKILHRSARFTDHQRIRRMATRKSDYHYLRTNIERSEPRKYASLEGAMAAMKDLLHLQGGRGFVTTREPDGKHSSRHPDGRGVQFWAEDARGVIVS